MSGELLFTLALHACGTLWLALGRNHLPRLFICGSGYAWGALLWVVLGAACIATGIPYTLNTMSLLYAVAIAAAIVLHWRAHSWRMTAGDGLSCLAGLALSLTVAAVAIHDNYAWPTYDGALQLMLGRSIALDGTVLWPQAGVVSYGIFLPLLHSAGVFVGEGYLPSAHPLMMTSLLTSFWSLGRLALLRSGASPRRSTQWLTLALTFLVSTYMLAMQAWLVHNSLVSSAFLLVAVLGSWFALRESSQTWFAVSACALAGFTLARTEAPLFTLAFLAIVLSTGALPYRMWLRTMIPCLAVVAVWYGTLLRFTLQYHDVILSPANTQATLAMLAAFGLLIVASTIPWIARQVVARLHVIVLAVLTAAVIVSFALMPVHMVTGTLALVRNAYYDGLWGGTWIVIVTLLCLAPAQPRLAHERVFSVFIAAFLLLLVALGSQRVPYRLGYGDSGNRMLTHLFPIALLYVMVKYDGGLRCRTSESAAPLQARLRVTIAATAGVIVLAGLAWLWQAW